MTAERTAWLAPLGLQRRRILACLGGDNPRLASYFPVADDADVFQAYARHVVALSREMASEPDPLVASLMGAARLLAGDVSGALTVLDHLPATAFKPDHGAGICLVAPLYAMVTALPLPAELTDTTRWLAGSPEQSALRQWIEAHRHRLTWVAADGVYRLSAGA